MNRTMALLEGELYHVYNRGNNRQLIFSDNHDYAFPISNSPLDKACIIP